jgi:hypothetical protein
MKKLLIYAIVGFVIVVCLPIRPASADDQIIPIPNAGFEDPVLADDSYTWLDIPSWTLVGGEGSGIWHVTSADFDPVVAPEGQNVLYTENAVGDAGGVSQVLTETFAADTDYTLTVEVGNSWFYYFSGYSVQLLAGGVVIAEDNDTLWPDYMKWATSTVVYTYDPADAALVGQPLEIRLLNLALNKDNPPEGDAVGIEFDNVTLSYVTDTEPAAPSNYVTSTDQGGLVPIINRDFSEPNDGKHTAFDIETSRKQDEPFFGFMTTDVPGWTTDVSPRDSGIEIGDDPNYGYSAFLMGGYSEWDDDPNWIEPSVWQILPYKIQQGDQFRLAVDARHIWTVEGVPVELIMTLFYVDINGTRQELASQIVDLTEAWEWSTYILDVPELPEVAVGKLLGIELQNMAERSSWIHVDNISLIGEE